ncbi:hypothetical protein ACHAC9_05570 [Massilia sp. CMS3.1]|uniref:hypothetical protein n=1 Tax=Massilia sp. CMS3.1 TaxID=3373083 RepID=UPI003EE4FF10
MLTISAYPIPAFPTVSMAPLFATWSNIAGLYRDATQASTQQLLQSSASIIQEHTLRAFISASNSCADALAKNALSVQQQSLGRFVDANQKAMGVMGRAFMQPWIGMMQPAK